MNLLVIIGGWTTLLVTFAALIFGSWYVWQAVCYLLIEHTLPWCRNFASKASVDTATRFTVGGKTFEAELFKIGPTFQTRRWKWNSIGFWIVFYAPKQGD